MGLATLARSDARSLSRFSFKPNTSSHCRGLRQRTKALMTEPSRSSSAAPVSNPPGNRPEAVKSLAMLMRSSRP